MPGQEVLDGAIAGRVPDGLFIGRREIIDVEHIARTDGPVEPCQQSLLLGQRHVRALAPAVGFGSSALIPPMS